MVEMVRGSDRIRCFFLKHKFDTRRGGGSKSKSKNPLTDDIRDALPFKSLYSHKEG